MLSKVIYGLVGMQVFQFADMYRGPYSNGLKRVVCPFYCSYSGYEVKLIVLSTFFYMHNYLVFEDKRGRELARVNRRDLC